MGGPETDDTCKKTLKVLQIMELCMGRMVKMSHAGGHPSIFLTSYPIQGRGAGDYPSCHEAKGQIHPGGVIQCPFMAQPERQITSHTVKAISS